MEIAENVEPEKMFDEKNYIEKLMEFMRRDDDVAKEELSEFVTNVWTQNSASNFQTETWPQDNGSKTGQPQIGMQQKRTIGGLQRISIAPPPISASASNSKGNLGILPKKPKKIVPIIDDSNSGRPCKSCGGTGDQKAILQCTDCQEFYHIQCSDPDLTPEDVENPRFIFVCKNCANAKVSLNSRPNSRSSSPSGFLAGKLMKKPNQK
ncbi:unnamed protein product [Caenorhabditis angaria]|uniref:PHD-type domain-containing protein n=1 Tax=Caenorhabditis angaria TaxID=860376 RepID=A0A9P1ISA4_9PELO|nr:unnamed protein product [Caenorhabditis angaria]